MSQSDKQMTNKNVLLVELLPSVPNLGRFIVMPRYGLMAIASVLAGKTDYNVRFLYEPYVGKITPKDIAEANPKYLLLNGLTTTADDNRELVKGVRQLMGNALTVISGGEHVTMFPEDAKSYSDYLLAYEGDESIIQLLNALDDGSPLRQQSCFQAIPGLHWRNRQGEWIFNKTPSRIERIDYRYDFTVMPGAKEASTRFRTGHMPLLTSRGCKFACSFCSWISLFGKSGYYVRPVDDVMHDILHAIDYTGIRQFIVADNLFAGDEEYTKTLMARIEETFRNREDKPVMTVLCRADQFSGGKGSLSESMIAAMARGGVENISLGLESISTRSLLQMRKQADLMKYYAASETLKRHGIKMLATFVAGFDGDTQEDIVNIAEFGEQMGLFTIQVYARNMVPGTVDDIMADHRNIPGTLNRYRNGHSVNFMPLQMLPSELQEAIFEASFRFHQKSVPGRNLALRAFRHIWSVLRPHIEGLKTLEREFLIPEGIYVPSAGGFRLDENMLYELIDDKTAYGKFSEISKAIFRKDGEADALQETFGFKTMVVPA